MYIESENSGDLAGLRRLEALDGKPYGVFRAGTNTDPFIRKSLKLFDRDYYDNLHGFTKRPGTVKDLYSSLGKFGGHDPKFSQLPEKLQQCFSDVKELAKEVWSSDYKLKLASYPNIMREVAKPTSAGISFPGCKKNEVIDDIVDYSRYLSHRAKYQGWRTEAPLSLASTRGGMTETSSDPKTRLVWNVAAEHICLEGRFAEPVIKLFMHKLGSPYIFGPNMMRRLKSRLHSCDLKYLGLDWSSFDATVPSFVIRWAFDLLWECYECSQPNWKTSRKRTKIKKVWEYIVYQFINMGIRMPDGRAWRKKKGIPSGSYFTSIVGSICNWIISMSLCKYVGIPVGIDGVAVGGDDGDFPIADSLSSEQVQSLLGVMSAVAEDELGMFINTKKTRLQTNVKERSFMGYAFRGGTLYRETTEWFKMMLYPEHSVTTLTISWSRVLGYIVVGAMNDRKVTRFILFYQTCYDLKRVRPHELRSQRFMFRVLDVKPNFNELRVLKLQNAIYGSREQAMRPDVQPDRHQILRHLLC